MRALGPLWAVALTIDRNVAGLLLLGNLLFVLFAAAVIFRRRAWFDRLLMTLGLFVLITSISFAGLYLYARTPVREIQVFAVD